MGFSCWVEQDTAEYERRCEREEARDRAIENLADNFKRRPICEQIQDCLSTATIPLIEKLCAAMKEAGKKGDRAIRDAAYLEFMCEVIDKGMEMLAEQEITEQVEA